MENSLTFNDIKLLLLQKKWIIVGLTLIFSILFGAYALYTEFSEDEEGATEIIEEPVDDSEYDLDTLLSADTELLTEEELTFIEDSLFEDAYSFRIYIENQDGSVYDRSNLLRELLTSPDILSSVETQTSAENLEDYQQHFIDIDLNSSNVVYTITLGLGDEQVNEEVSQAYYEAFQNNEFEIISNKLTKLFGSPELVESEEEMEEPVLADDGEVSITSIILAIVIGGLFGLAFGIFLVFFLAVLAKKITPIYNYRLSEKDSFTNFSHLNMKDNERFASLMHTVLYPTSSRKLIVSQDRELNAKVSSKLEEVLDSQSVTTTNVNEVDPSLNFDELIIITENGLTEKKWYIKQKNQLRTYKKPYQVVKLR